MRTKKSATNITATFDCTITDAVGGIVSIALDNATTTGIAAGTYYYDIELYTAADAEVYRILNGKAIVDGEVTK